MTRLALFALLFAACDPIEVPAITAALADAGAADAQPDPVQCKPRDADCRAHSECCALRGGRNWCDPATLRCGPAPR